MIKRQAIILLFTCESIHLCLGKNEGRDGGGSFEVVGAMGPRQGIELPKSNVIQAVSDQEV